MRSFEETARLDDLLQQLSFYEVTEGKMITPKTADDITSVHQKVAQKFNYYKDLIQRGECSFDMIREDVLGHYGPFPRPKPIDFTDPKSFEKPQEQIEKKSFESEAQETEYLISNLLKNFLPGIDITKVKLIDASKVPNTASGKLKIEDIPNDSQDPAMPENTDKTPPVNDNLSKPKKNRKKPQ